MTISTHTKQEVASVLNNRLGRLMSIADTQRCRVADLVAVGLDRVIEDNHRSELQAEIRAAKRAASRLGIEWTADMDDVIFTSWSAGVGDRVIAAELGVSHTSVWSRRHALGYVTNKEGN